MPQLDREQAFKALEHAGLYLLEPLEVQDSPGGNTWTGEMPKKLCGKMYFPQSTEWAEASTSHLPTWIGAFLLNRKDLFMFFF